MKSFIYKTSRLLLTLSLLTATHTLSAAPSKPAPPLASNHALVLDEKNNTLISKKADKPTSIASITKLMTAMVVLDARQSPSQLLTISKKDRDRLKNTRSRLKFGATLSRATMLRLALSSSENRAAHALARYYPGGTSAFVTAMNRKARSLGMFSTRFRDPTGLNPGNLSTAKDLAKMVRAALKYPLIRQASTTKETVVRPFKNKKPMVYRTTNRFLRSNNEDWTIKLSKTGFINEAGRCLVMRAKTAGKEMTIVLLDSTGKGSPYGDSNRIRDWLMGKKPKAIRKKPQRLNKRLFLRL